MVAYIDSSVVVDAILEGTPIADHIWSVGKVTSSELLTIECRRAILREHMRGKLNDEEILDAFDQLLLIQRQTDILVLTHGIKQRAGESFPIHVKTLDALHLATALAVKAEFEEEVVVFSRDQTMNRCAKLLGLAAPWL